MWICQIILHGNHDPQIPQSPEELEILEVQKLMLSLLTTEEDGRANRLVEYGDVFT
ncbi:hypothetical protein COMA1_20612 [Candidatus Nitrospira nitrosa]|uniref:Uncharacterized protein n=1 Tax=Candidatus Nitrospira nitrosa TaxID=1742972 RepID=A0A0S4LLR3_9BACT|nr:hypothetical protein COMA1_20612 [Candidatus Nitrospira nitrosa]